MDATQNTIVSDAGSDSAEASQGAAEYEAQIALAREQSAWKAFGTCGFDSYLETVAPGMASSLRTVDSVAGFLALLGE